MVSTRKAKPDWFKLVDRIKAAIEIGAGTYQDLSAFVDVAPARYFEWVSGKVEPKAQVVLKIQKWLENAEIRIAADPVFQAQYDKAVRNARKS